MKPQKCQYTYYAKVEKGERVPKSDVAIELIELLEVNPQEGINAWACSSIDDPQYKKYFDLKPTEMSLEEFHKFRDQTAELNRKQVKMFSKEMIYYDVLLYIVSHSMREKVKLENIMADFEISKERALEVIDGLYDEGLVDKSPKGYYCPKPYVFVPPKQEFKSFRRKCFSQILTQYYKSEDKFLKSEEKDFFSKKFANTVLLNETQLNAIYADMQRICLGIKSNPTDVKPGSVPVSLGFVISKRSWN
jgi:predicted DNA-binding transcriptional regulator